MTMPAPPHPSAGHAPPPVLSVRDLTVSFGTPGHRVPVVHGISFDIPARHTVALVGESGSGKSATALAIMRLLGKGVHVTGQVDLNSMPLFNLPDAQMRKVRGDMISMIFQEPMTSLNPTMPVGEQIVEALVWHRGLDRRQARREALGLLERVQIPAAAARLADYPHQMSGGMRQRVMIATALACKPNLLIADEPTTALDVTIQAQILQLLRDIQAEDDLSILFITHDMGVVAEIADETIVMLRGNLVESGATEQIFSHPKHRYTRQLLALVPKPGALAGNHGPQPFPLIDEKSGDLVAPEQRPDTVHPESTVLEVRNLVKHFEIRKGLFSRLVGRVHAVDDISFRIRSGETLSLVGESGCGKSTVARCVMGLAEATGGSISIDGRNFRAEHPAVKRDILKSAQMIFQDPYSSLNPRMPIGTSIAEPMAIKGGQSRHRICERVADLLRAVGMEPEAQERFPHEFSGGQRQRICIARALALNARLIVADEAVSALDVSIKAQVVNLMLQLQQSTGVSFLFISHDMAVVERVSHRVAVMYLGRIVEIGDRASIFGNPCHPYTRRLLSAVPVAEPGRLRVFETSQYNAEIKSPIRCANYHSPQLRYRQVGPDHQVLDDE